MNAKIPIVDRGFVNYNKNKIKADKNNGHKINVVAHVIFG